MFDSFSYNTTRLLGQWDKPCSAATLQRFWDGVCDKSGEPMFSEEQVNAGIDRLISAADKWAPKPVDLARVIREARRGQSDSAVRRSNCDKCGGGGRREANVKVGEFLDPYPVKCDCPAGEQWKSEKWYTSDGFMSFAARRFPGREVVWR